MILKPWYMNSHEQVIESHIGYDGLLFSRARNLFKTNMEYVAHILNITAASRKLRTFRRYWDKAHIS